MTRNRLTLSFAAVLQIAVVGVRAQTAQKSPAARPAPAKQTSSAPRTPASAPTAPAAHPVAAAKPAPTQAAFKSVTDSLFTNTCEECHNNIEVAGGLDLSRYTSVE